MRDHTILRIWNALSETWSASTFSPQKESTHLGERYSSEYQPTPKCMPKVNMMEQRKKRGVFLNQKEPNILMFWEKTRFYLYPRKLWTIMERWRHVSVYISPSWWICALYKYPIVLLFFELSCKDDVTFLFISRFLGTTNVLPYSDKIVKLTVRNVSPAICDDKREIFIDPNILHLFTRHS